MTRSYFNLLLLLICSFGLQAQSIDLVFPDFNQYEDFNNAYLAPEGRGFLIGSCNILYRTADGGNSWEVAPPLGDRVFPNSIFCEPGTNCAKAYAGGSRGLYRTTDGGNNWTQVDNRQMTKFNFSIPGVIYGYLRSGGEFYQSEDDGLTWTNTALPGTLFDDIRFLSPTRFAIINDSSFYLSEDSGANWTKTHTFPNRTSKMIDGDGSSFYVIIRNGDVYKSEDNGQSFSLRAERITTSSSFQYFHQDTQDSLHLISFGGSRISSGDDGLTWTVASGPRSQSYRGFRLAEDRLIGFGEGLTLIVGNPDYTDMEQLVSTQAVKFHDIVFHDADTGYAFGERGEVLRTQNGGESWDFVETIGDWMGSRPKLGPDGTLYGVLGFTDFARSTDGGEGWLVLNAANQALEGGRRVFDVLPNGDVQVMTSQRTVRLSPDGNVLSFADGGHPSVNGGTFDLKMIDENLGFIIRWARLEIYRTEDAGVTWDTIPSFGGNNFFTWFEVEDENTFVIGNGSGAWRSTDRGFNWTELRSEVSLGRFNIGLDSFGFNRSSLFRVREGSTFWEEMISTCGRPRDMVRRPGTNEFFLAYENGIERLNVDELLSPVRQSRPEVTPLRAVPNPSNGMVKVDIPGNEAQRGTAELFDLTGRRVTVPTAQFGPQLELDLSTLRPGYYIMRYASAEGKLFQARLIRR
jgi:photosystem II stability/assembly factor-like uncharacterized protein